MKFVAISLSLLLAFQPMMVLAQDEEPDIALIRRVGAPAPFTGVLMSDEAFAKQKLEREQLEERLELRRRTDLRLLESRLKLETATTAAALDAEKTKRIEIVAIKDRRIAQLEESLVKADEKSSSSMMENIFWMIGGAAAVALGGLVVAAVAGAFDK